MARLLRLAAVACAIGAECRRAGAGVLRSRSGAAEDCSWAKLDETIGWRCETIRSFFDGAQANTRLVNLYPDLPSAHRSFQAVLKGADSNTNPSGLVALENERRIVAGLSEAGFKKMPVYSLNFTVKPEFVKYLHADTMSQHDKDMCDALADKEIRLGQTSVYFTGVCSLNPAWDACNGVRGYISTSNRSAKNEELTCPDAQVLVMEYMHGYANLNDVQRMLSREDAFRREVRAAALFLAYDELRKAGVLHCDFNPGNVMFSREDPTKVVILDFGLSRFAAEEPNNDTLCWEDIGEPGYLWLNMYMGHGCAQARLTGGNEYFYDEREDHADGAGRLTLSRHTTFQTPSGRELLPFSKMRGKFNGLGGNKPWRMETLNNWPGIVAYAEELVREWESSASKPLECPDRAMRSHDCGYPGMTETECRDRDCCWDPNDRPQSNQCYKKRANVFAAPRCPSEQGWAVSQREHCIQFDDIELVDGSLEARAAECERIGCCWDRLQDGSEEPWCFQMPVLSAETRTSPWE